VVLPAYARDKAVLTAVNDLPVPALIFKAVFNASWLVVIEPVIVSYC
jgi:hypothetical protein